MIKIIKKRENERLLIGIIVNLSTIRKRIKLIKLGLRVIFSSPKNIRFEEKDNTFSFYFSQQEKLPLGGLQSGRKKNTPKISKRIKRIFAKEKFIKSAAGLTIFALVFQFAAIMPKFHNLAMAAEMNNNSMCGFNTDVILAIDITQSMNEGAQPSRCEWTELRQVPGEDYFTWFLNKKYNIDEEWCQNVRDSYDETGEYHSYKEPTYIPPVLSKLEAAKQAAQGFVDNLKSQDQSGVVSFSESANLNKTLSFDHNNTKSIIAGLTAQSGSNTNIFGAINRSIEEFSSERSRMYALHVLILLSDGSDNNNELVSQKTQEALEMGIRIFTIGLGQNANQNQLQNIAQTTGGQYHFASDQTQLDNIYTQISQEICQFSAQCQQTQTAGECVDDGLREIQTDWNYDFCGEPSTFTEDDESCACAEEEENRTCVADGVAQVTYVWNYDYCGDNPEPQTVADENCACVYTDWEDGDCVGDGMREQTRTAISEFEYCQDLSQTVEDPTCAQESGEEEEGGEQEGGGEEEQVLGFISGHKYNDLNKNSQIDEGEPGLTGWTILLEKEGNEGWEIVNQTTTDDQGYYIFEDLETGNYRVREVLPQGSNWEQTYPENSFWEISLQEGDTIEDINFANYQPLCGNNILDEDEQCDDGNLLDGDGCSSVCQIEEEQQGGGEEQGNEQQEEEQQEGGNEQQEGEENQESGEQGGDQGVNIGGLGGVVLVPPPSNNTGGEGGNTEGEVETETETETETEEPLSIIEGSIKVNQRQVQEGENYSIVITWETSHPATSQVIYAQEGEQHTFDINDNQGNPPKYGYAHTTPEYDTNPKVILHSVTISGLEPGATYYFRCVSRGSFIVSDEQTFTVKDLVKIKKIVEMQKNLAKIEAQLTMVGYEVEKLNKETGSEEKGEEIEQEKPEGGTLLEENEEEEMVKPQETSIATGTAQTERKSLLAALGLLSGGAKIGLIILIVAAAAILLYYLLYFRKRKRRSR